MRKIQLLVILCSVLFLSAPNVFASGGSVGASPGTGIKVRFGGGTDISLPIRFEGEGYLGDNDQHGVGGNIGFDIGTGFNFNYFGITPEYKYYFNGGKESGAFVGAYGDFRFATGTFGGSFNNIGIGGQGGYQHVFDFDLAIYGAGNIGFSTVGNSFGRNNGGEIGFRAGVKYIFGRN